MGIYNTYAEAYARARVDATEFNRPMGIEVAREYKRVVWRTRMIPKDPARRVGAELRCEVVEPAATPEGKG